MMILEGREDTITRSATEVYFASSLDILSHGAVEFQAILFSSMKVVPLTGRRALGCFCGCCERHINQ